MLVVDATADAEANTGEDVETGAGADTGTDTGVDADVAVNDDFDTADVEGYTGKELDLLVSLLFDIDQLSVMHDNRSWVFCVYCMHWVVFVGGVYTFELGEGFDHLHNLR